MSVRTYINKMGRPDLKAGAAMFVFFLGLLEGLTGGLATMTGTGGNTVGLKAGTI